MQSPIYRRSLALLQTEIGNELVAFDAESGNCFGLNEMAAEIWELLKTPKSFEDLQAILLREYDVSADRCAAELRSLLDELVANRLIAADGNAEP